MTYITSDLRKRNRDRAGVPDIKSMEQTGRDTVVIHTRGKDKFEGKFNPNTHRIINGKIAPR
jgi:hypothetical protein